MSGQQPQGSLSLVLLPSGAHGEEGLAVAKSWASEGFLKRALWVPTESVQPSTYGGVQARGVLLDRGQAAEVDAFAMLSRARLRTLTVVILQVSDPDQPVDSAQLEAAELLVPALRRARPEALIPAEASNPVSVLLVNLLTGPTGMSGVPYETVASRAYHANLIASPEDRRAADQMDRFVRPGDNLVNWAMAQCAIVGGLWSGMPEGPVQVLRDTTEDSSMSQSDFVQPIRGYARIVASAPTARRVLATAMAELRFEDKNALMAKDIVPVSDPSLHLDRTLEALDTVDGGRIFYATPTALPEPGSDRHGLFAALGDFLKFSGREIVAVPSFLVRRTLARVGAKTTKIMSGEGGHMEVHVFGEAPEVARFTEAFERQSIEAERSLDAVEGGVPPAAPELWRVLRATIFGLLDGSPIPDPVPTPVVAGQRIVMPSTTLVVPPPNPWAPTSEELNDLAGQLGIDSLFVPSVASWRAEWLEDQLTEAWEREQQRLEALEVARAEALAGGTSTTAAIPTSDAHAQESPEVADKPAAPVADKPATPVAAGPEAKPAAPRSATAARLTQIDADIETHKQQAATYRREQDHLAAWVRNRENSLMWRLANRVQTRTIEAREDAERFREVALSVPEVDSEELRRARNQFANRFLTIVGVSLFLSMVLWLLAGPLSTVIALPMLPISLIVGAVIAVWLVVVLLKYYRRRSRFLAQARLLLHQQRDAVRQCREAMTAERRLAGLYEQLVDWGEILGYAVHDPWQPRDAWFSGRPAADLQATLPSCVDVAVPDPDDEAGFSRLKSAAMRSLAGAGWRSRAFNVLLERFLERQHAEDTSAVVHQLDMDSPATPNGYRNLMLTLLREDQLQPAAAEHVLRSKAADIYANQDTLVHHALVPINSEYAAEATDLLDEGADLEFMRPEWGDFLAGALNGTTQFSVNLWSDEGQAANRARQQMNTLTYAPPRMSHNLQTPTQSVIQTLAADMNRGVDLSARCDFGPQVEKKHLRLFAGSKADILWPPPIPDHVATTPHDVDMYN